LVSDSDIAVFIIVRYFSLIYIVNDDSPYRDVLLYINGSLSDSNTLETKRSLNYTIGLEDDLTIVIRAVGNVSVIKAASDTRFTCRTSFTCNRQAGAIGYIPNRILQCSLRSPAKLGDNGGTLIVSIDDVELARVFINCKLF